MTASLLGVPRAAEVSGGAGIARTVREEVVGEVHCGRGGHLFADCIEFFLADSAGGLGYVPQLDQGHDRDDYAVAFHRLVERVSGSTGETGGVVAVPDDGVGVRDDPHDSSKSLLLATSLASSKSSQLGSGNPFSEQRKTGAATACSAGITRKWEPG